MKKEDIKNKYYDEFEISAKSRDKITKGVIEDLKNIPASSIVDMDEWRIEKMRKEKTYFDLVKKIGIASLSIIATGAIVLGVMKYTEGKNNTKNAKESTTTEYSTENKNTDDEEYVQVFKNLVGKIIEKSSLDTALAQVEVKDYIIEIEGDKKDEPYIESQTCMWIAIKGKNDNKFKEVKEFKFENKDDVYFNGKYMFSKYQNELYKYDITKGMVETMHSEYQYDQCENNDKLQNGEITGIKEIITVKKGKVYYVTREEIADDNVCGAVCFNICSWDIKGGNTSEEIRDYYGSYIDYEDYMVVQYDNEEDTSVLSLYGFTPDGLKKEKQIRENIEYEAGCDAKVYYLGGDVFERRKEEYEPLMNFTIYSYDIKTGKEKNLGDINVKDFGKKADYISHVDLFGDQWCEIVVNTKDNETRSYKYTYATKKIEKMVFNRD
ncbi:hypothetical protein [uncultured Eubacterium sp.]|uniref:hypothetical protein n=1 Tax=uncultured Eubacterium sp. TaxID=165185 RepID=UPI002599632A|nr:hypothetical protein [uncultured Eubacterium sp.]